MEKRFKKVRGLVLRKFPYSESSDIIILFTAGYGKIRAVAKGRRRPGSRLGAPLENFSFAEIILHWHTERELQLIKDANLIDPHPDLARNYKFLKAASFVSELLERGTELYSPNRALFELSLFALKLIPLSRDLKKLLSSYLIKALSFMGHRPQLEKCTVCGKSGNLLYFSTEKGGIVCSRCANSLENIISISTSRLSELRALQTLPIDKADRLKADGESILELLVDFARFHLGIPDLFAGKVDI